MNQKPNSNKPNALASLRKVIREEVKSAIKEEMVPILLEIVKARPTYTAQPAPAPVTAAKMSNPMLEETRMEMLSKLGLGDTSDFRSMMSTTSPNFAEQQPVYQQPVIQEQLEDPSYQVNRMLMTANKSSKEEMVEINEVPDFSALMKKMNM